MELKVFKDKQNKKNKVKTSKKQIVENDYLVNGYSELIHRYSLKKPLSWTSGDSLFRSDSDLGKEYKFFRFSKIFNPRNHSQCWDFTEDDEQNMKDIHSKLTWEKSGRTVEWVKFFGKLKKIQDDKCINPDIKKIIFNMTCCHCGSNKNIQCDHKDDFKTDIKALNPKTQKLEHFQPLCGSCNTRKREDKMKTIKTGKRQPPPSNIDYGIDFIKGDETFNKQNPNRIGTYWYDCCDFRKKAQELNNKKILEQKNLEITKLLEHNKKLKQIISQINNLSKILKEES